MGVHLRSAQSTRLYCSAGRGALDRADWPKQLLLSGAGIKIIICAGLTYSFVPRCPFQPVRHATISQPRLLLRRPWGARMPRQLLPHPQHLCDSRNTEPRISQISAASDNFAKEKYLLMGELASCCMAPCHRATDPAGLLPGALRR